MQFLFSYGFRARVQEIHIISDFIVCEIDTKFVTYREIHV